MNAHRRFAHACIALALFAIAAMSAPTALADTAAEAPAAGQPEMKLPEGWTPQDMQAMIEAGTPGKMHQRLTGDAGLWRGKTTMWMGPDGEPMTGQCTSTITPIMDGRFIKCVMEGTMPGMGEYHGFGLYGYDNVAGQFVSTWVDNHGTGIAKGTGKLSDDGKTLSWTFTASCPIAKHDVTFREVETITGPNTKTLEMFGQDPKTGEEYKMMRIELTKAEGGRAATGK